MLKDHPVYRSRFNDFCPRKLFADAIRIAEERVKLLQMDGPVDRSSADVVKALKLIAASKSALCELELNLSVLTDILGRQSELDDQRDALIINTLSMWLDNIQRIKANVSIDR